MANDSNLQKDITDIKKELKMLRLENKHLKAELAKQKRVNGLKNRELNSKISTIQRYMERRGR